MHYVLVREMISYIFGFFQKISRPTEIAVGIIFIVVSFFVGQLILEAEFRKISS